MLVHPPMAHLFMWCVICYLPTECTAFLQSIRIAKFSWYSKHQITLTNLSTCEEHLHSPVQRPSAVQMQFTSSEWEKMKQSWHRETQVSAFGNWFTIYKSLVWKLFIIYTALQTTKMHISTLSGVNHVHYNSRLFFILPIRYCPYQCAIDRVIEHLFVNKLLSCSDDYDI